MKTLRLILLLLLTAQHLAAAPSYRTQRLEQIAHAIHLTLPEPLQPNAQMDSVTTHLGKPIHVCTNAFGEVSHIGYQLFAPALVEYYQNEPLFHFVERYLLELDLRIDGKSPDVRMDVDQVVLTRGSISLLRALTPQSNLSFDLEEIRRHFFRMTWRMESGSEVCMVIPADCMLIVGANSPEMELMAERDLLRAKPLDNKDIMLRWAEAKGYRGDKMLILDVGAYMSRYIRGDLYLSEENGQLLFNPWQSTQSVTNLMLTGIGERDIPMSLTMNRYGGKRDVLDITLRQYISYCLAEGCVLYFGVKQKTDTELTGALFAYNARFAYTHLLDVTVPLSLLNEEGSGKIQSTAWVYIPLKLLDDHLFDKQFSRMPEKE